MFLTLLLFLIWITIDQNIYYVFNTKLFYIPYILFSLSLVTNLFRVFIVISHAETQNKREFNFIKDHFQYLVNKSEKINASQQETFFIHPLEKFEFEILETISNEDPSTFVFFKNLIVDIPILYQKRRKQKKLNLNSRLFQKWEGLNWHKRLLVKIVKQVAKSNNVDFIHEVISTLLKISWNALKNNQLNIYKEYIRLQIYPCKYNSKDNTWDVLIKTNIMWMREIAQYQIIPGIEKDEYKTDNLHDSLFLPLFLSFQDLLKDFLEKKDNNSFEYCLNNYLSILDIKVNKDEAFPKINTWIETNNVKSIFAKALFLQYKTLQGILMWGFHLYNKSSDLNFKTNIDFISNELCKLSFNEALFLTLENIHFDNNERLGWDNWSIFNNSNNNFVFTEIKTYDYVIDSFIFLNIKKQLYITDNFDFYAEDINNSKDILSHLESIEKRVDNFILNNEDWDLTEEEYTINKTALKTKLNDIIESIKNRRTILIQDTKINEIKVDSFKKMFFDNYKNHKGLIDFYDVKNKVSLTNPKPSTASAFFLNKEKFIDDSNISLEFLPGQLADKMKRASNEKILNNLLDKAQRIEVSEFFIKIENLNNPIIFCSRRNVRKLSNKHNIRFISNRDINSGKWQKWQDIPRYEGYYIINQIRVPIINIERINEEDNILLLEEDSIGLIELDSKELNNHGIQCVITEFIDDDQINKMKQARSVELANDEIKNQVLVEIKMSINFIGTVNGYKIQID